jgi:nitrate reductase (NAD(P)H)
MTLGFSELVIGDFVELKGPIGHFVWKGTGVAEIHGQERRIREIGLVCGGSGITPILQVLRGILHDTSHHDTQVWVLDINRYFDDILCRDELHQLAKEYADRYRLHHTLTGVPAPDGWKYSIGRVNDKMLRSHLPSPAKDSIVCICGPSAMEQVIKGARYSNCAVNRRI